MPRSSKGHGLTMEPFEYGMIALGLALLGSNWKLHRDIADLRERVAKLEGLFEGFMRGNNVPREN